MSDRYVEFGLYDPYELDQPPTPMPYWVAALFASPAALSVCLAAYILVQVRSGSVPIAPAELSSAPAVMQTLPVAPDALDLASDGVAKQW